MVTVFFFLVDVITWITGVEAIKQQTSAACGCIAVGQSPLAQAWTAA